MKRFLLISCICLSGLVSFSTTRTTNGSSTNWNLASAWTPSGVPDVNQFPNDVAIVNHNMNLSGSLIARSSSGFHTMVTIKSGVTLTITGSLTVNAGEFDIQSGGTVNVGGLVTVTVNGDLVVDGILNANGGLTVTSSGSVISSASSDINITGNLVTQGTQASTFNGDMNITGNISSSGGPKSNTFGGIITVDGDLTGVGSNGFVVTGVLDVAGDLDLSANATLNGSGVIGWGAIDVFGPGASYIQCNNGTRYDSHVSGTYPDPPANPFDLGTCSSGALPIELLIFNSSIDDGVTNLHWTTSQELDNDYFVIERSKLGSNWNIVSTIPGAGNSNGILNYTITDPMPFANKMYYRLKQVDFDGRMSYSQIIQVDAGIKKDQLFVSPNPATDNITFALQEDKAPVVYQLMCQDGSVFHSGESLIKDSSIHLDLINAPRGVYILRVAYSWGVVSEKVVLL